MRTVGSVRFLDRQVDAEFFFNLFFQEFQKMIKSKMLVIVSLVALLVPGIGVANKPVATSSLSNNDVSRLIDEGMNRSEAMNIMKYLTDVIGPRLTNSPGQRRANQWTKEQLEKWGLKNSTVDPWGEFGRGWELKNFKASVRTNTEFIPVRAFPKAWSPSTNGAITGDVVYVNASNEEELQKYKGKLKGAMILISPERRVSPGFNPVATRRGEKELAEMEAALAQPAGGQNPMQQGTPEQRAAFMAAQQFQAAKMRFYYDEGAAVLIEPSQGVDSGTIRVMGASLPPGVGGPANPDLRVYSKGAPSPLPQLVAEVEQYNRLYRLSRQNISMKMTVELDAQFFDDDLTGYNTIAEIPGTDLADEVVMIGAHLDSWHAGTGATDNGAGVTVVMEAMRILQASGIKPRRTIRVALWTGEEQGLLGSRYYVAKNLASDSKGEPVGRTGPNAGQGVVKKAGYDKFSAYYNLDNGTGQIRGVYMQGNEAARSIFKGWLQPFGDWNATSTTIRSTGGTDHLAFDAVGLPGFQFIQDEVEYQGRTWHTTQDVADRTIEDDLKKSSVIMATFALQSAMMDQRVPRKNAPAGLVAAILGVFNPAILNDEIAFQNAGFGHMLCGHEIEGHEIPTGFPKMLTVGQRFLAE